MKKKILLVENEEEIASYFKAKFSYLGDFYAAISHEAALHLLPEQNWDLFILDCFLDNQKTAFDLIPVFRESSPRAKIIMITGYADKPLAIKALHAGVDGLLEKPLEEVSLRQRLEELGWFDSLLSLDLKRRQLFVGDKSYILTHVEFILLQRLMERKNQLVARGDLESEVWQGRHVAKNALDTHLYNLKKKIPALKTCLSSVHGAGYMLKIQ